MNTRVMFSVLLILTAFSADPALGQIFPLEPIKKVHWGMKLEDLQRVKPGGELKNERGRIIYTIRDTLWGHSFGFGFAFQSNDDSISTISVIAFRQQNGADKEYLQLSDQLRLLLIAHYGKADSEKTILGQTMMRWRSSRESILFIKTNDGVIITYSRI
jgi:hypothetical protein